MLSKNIVVHLKNKGWWFDDASEDYKKALEKLGVEPSSDISLFYSHAEDGPTFYSRKKEIYQLGWFLLNSNYEFDLKRCHEVLGLPKSFIPLDSFEGETGFFYNKETGEVVDLALGEKLQDFKNGRLKPQWKDFNLFLEWFFEL